MDNKRLDIFLLKFWLTIHPASDPWVRLLKLADLAHHRRQGVIVPNVTVGHHGGFLSE